MVVEITWLDSGSTDEIWRFKDEPYPEPHVCTSVGYLIEKDKHKTIIAQSMNKDQLGRIFVIPTVSITKIKELSVNKETIQ